MKMGTAEGQTARSTSSLAHQANNNNKNILINHQGDHNIIHRSSKIVKLRSRVPNLPKFPQKLSKDGRTLAALPDAPTAHTVQALRKRERGGAH